MGFLDNDLAGRIVNYMSECRGYFSEWYVGVTSDPEDKLFNEHKVDQYKDDWIYMAASSVNIAHNSDSIDDNVVSKMIYAYKKAPALITEYSTDFEFDLAS